MTGKPDEPVNRPRLPANMLVLGTIKFALELAGAAGFAWWGWTLGNGGPLGTILAILFPVIAFTIWGVFAVKDDPSRNPNPPVAIPGWLRLMIEAAFFGLAAYGIWTSGSRALAETLLTAVGIVYFVSYDRVFWLLKQR